MSFMQPAVSVGAKVARQASKVRGATLVYRRSGEADIDISAADWGLGERNTPAEEGEGYVNEYMVQDWFLVFEIFTGSPLTIKQPLEGDRLIYTEGGVVMTWEVMAEAPDAAARHSERFKTHWRIHTKLIDEI